MKKLLFVALMSALLVILPIASAEQDNPATIELSTKKDRMSYAIGLRIGSDLQQLQDQIDANMLFQGLTDSLNGKEPLLSAAEAAEAQNEFGKLIQKLRERRISEMSQANAEQGQKFLVANRTKEGVTTTPSGLQYEVLKQGEGKKPGKDDSVTVHYRGTLIDGTEFDSSYSRGQPATFPVGGVIAGWTEALQLMPVGSTYRLVIPSDLAYGNRGAGPQIGPNATLIFDVELLSIDE